MAANEMSSTQMQDELKDITECCICTETFRDPRILPCIHTFCKTCLEDCGYKSGKKSGDAMPCPLCRTEFVIPVEGFSGIQKNFFMARLTEMTKSSNASSEPSRTLCDACCEDEIEMFCKECCLNMCNECCKGHQKNKVTRNHEIVSIADHQKTPGKTQANLETDFCKKHDKERLRLYCFDCKKVVCAFCYIENHQNHKWSDVSKAAETFRSNIQLNIWSLAIRNRGLQEKKEKLSQAKANIQKSVKSLELKINQRKAFLTEKIEQHASLLLNYLQAIHQDKLASIELQEKDIDALMTNQDSYSLQCQQMKEDRSDGDVCRVEAELCQRAAKLQKMNDSICQQSIELFNVNFKVSKLDQFTKKNGMNFVGSIEAAGAAEPEEKVDTGPVKAEVKGAKSAKKQSDHVASKAKASQEGKKTEAPVNPQQKTKMPKAGIVPGMPGAQQMRGSRPMGQQQQVRPAQMARPITGAPAAVGQQNAMIPTFMMQSMFALPYVRPQAIPYRLRAPVQLNSGQAMIQLPPAAVRVGDQAPLTASMLAEAPPQEQKQMLGERLFPLIHNMYPELAGKITGMLLEIDNSQLLHMLESRESFEAKVQEAVAVLQAHQASECA